MWGKSKLMLDFFCGWRQNILSKSTFSRFLSLSFSQLVVKIAQATEFLNFEDFSEHFPQYLKLSITLNLKLAPNICRKGILTPALWNLSDNENSDIIFVIFSSQMYFWAQFFSTWKCLNCGDVFYITHMPYVDNFRFSTSVMWRHLKFLHM